MFHIRAEADRKIFLDKRKALDDVALLMKASYPPVTMNVFTKDTGLEDILMDKANGHVGCTYQGVSLLLSTN